MNHVNEMVQIGMMAALSAVKQTLNLYPDGMTAEEVNDMISEIDQRLGLGAVTLQLAKRA